MLQPSQECFCCQCSRDTNSQEDPTIPGATTCAASVLKGLANALLRTLV